ncbi:MAG: ATP phosphoribosyltransferase regulatory subunit [Clostridia bacterium]|nr:ATP phosphoribosyltransferase regulatory subunit [Clostridia bacterium]
MKNIKNIPAGSRDLIYEEAVAPRQIEDKLLSLFYKLGYKPVSTPVLEYYTAFNHDKSDIKEESIFRFSDMDGKTVVLRPDNTSPIARVAMSKLKDETLPLTLCYSQEVFRNRAAFHAKRSQMLQAGVEIIGGESREEDIRCIFTALEALKASGNGAKLEIGHASFFEALVSEYGLDENDTENLRMYIAAKNSGEYTFTTALKNPKAVELAGKLQRLYGGISVIDEAQKLAYGNKNALAILEEIRYIVDVFTQAGYGEMLLIDLGIVQKIEYYTGIVFRGYVDGIGEAVLSGGRYDSLLDAFGSDLSACGFGLNISALSELSPATLPETKKLSFENGAKDIIAAAEYLKK